MISRVVIVGVGNVLCGDDGLGVHAVQRIQATGTLPRGVRALDGGVLGPALLAQLQPDEALVLMDALRAGGTPGAVYRLDLASLELEADVPLSLHDLGLRDTVLVDFSLEHRPAPADYT